MLKKIKKPPYADKNNDPDGSYTGTRIPSEEKITTDDLTPVQDVDDL